MKQRTLKFKGKPIRIRKVISGGQTGADIAGLRAARSAGVRTGGYIPKGFRTDEGDKPRYAKKYGLEETSSRDYRQRTEKNVKAADITLIFSPASRSPGSVLTKNLCVKHNKPYLWVNKLTWEAVDSAVGLISACANGKITLNIAGNREKSHPGIAKEVKWIVRAIIQAFNSPKK